MSGDGPDAVVPAAGPRVVLFDVDGTLLPLPSAERRFIAHLLGQGRLGPAGLGRALLFAARWAPVFGRDTLRKDKAWLAGLAVDEVASWADAFVAQHLLPRLRPTLLARLAGHRVAGERIALLSGALDALLRPLATALRADAFAGTRCATEGGRYLDAPPPVHPLGEAKVPLAEQLCARLGARLDDAVVYADAASDVPLLERAARAVAVTPDATLRAEARRRGWEIVDPPLLARRGAAAEALG